MTATQSYVPEGLLALVEELPGDTEHMELIRTIEKIQDDLCHLFSKADLVSMTPAVRVYIISAKGNLSSSLWSFSIKHIDKLKWGDTPEERLAFTKILANDYVDLIRESIIQGH